MGKMNEVDENEEVQPEEIKKKEWYDEQPGYMDIVDWINNKPVEKLIDKNKEQELEGIFLGFSKSDIIYLVIMFILIGIKLLIIYI